MFNKLVDMTEGEYLVYSDKALVILGKHSDIIRVPELVRMEDGPEKENLFKILEKYIYLLPLVDKDEEDEEVWKYCSNMVPKKVLAVDFGALKNVLDGLGQNVKRDDLTKMIDNTKNLGKTFLDFLLGTEDLRKELEGMNLDRLEKDVNDWLEKVDPENLEAFKKAMEAQDEEKMLDIMGIDVTNLDDFVTIFSLYPSEIEQISQKFQAKEGEDADQLKVRLKNYLDDTGLNNVIHMVYSDDDELATLFLVPNTNEKAIDVLSKIGTKIDNIDDLARLSDDGDRIKEIFKSNVKEIRKSNPKAPPEEIWDALLSRNIWKI